MAAVAHDELGSDRPFMFPQVSFNLSCPGFRSLHCPRSLLGGRLCVYQRSSHVTCRLAKNTHFQPEVARQQCNRTPPPTRHVMTQTVGRLAGYRNFPKVWSMDPWGSLKLRCWRFSRKKGGTSLTPNIQTQNSGRLGGSVG